MKSRIIFTLILLLSASTFSFSFPAKGNPVNGGEIYIELEPEDVFIAKVETDKNGQFKFSFPDGIKIPKKGTFSMTITPPKKLKGKKSMEMVKQTIKVPFNKKDGPKFKYFLTWDLDSKAQTKGAFAISGKSAT